MRVVSSVLVVAVVGCRTGGETPSTNFEQDGVTEDWCLERTLEIEASMDADTFDYDIPEETRSELISGASLWRGELDVLANLDEFGMVRSAGDLDGDGHTDLHVSVNGEGALLSGVDLLSGYDPQSLARLPAPTHFLKVGAYDINGDGRPEGMVWENGWIRFADGPSLLSGAATVDESSDALILPQEWTTASPYPTDVDGDDIDDLIVHLSGLSDEGLPISSQASFLATDLHLGLREPGAGAAPFRMGDVDGDGLPEFTTSTSRALWPGTLLSGVEFDIDGATPVVEWQQGVQLSVDFGALDADSDQEALVFAASPNDTIIPACGRIAALELDTLDAQVTDADLAHAPLQAYMVLWAEVVGDVDGDGIADAIVIGWNLDPFEYEVGAISGVDYLAGRTSIDEAKIPIARDGMVLVQLYMLGDVDGDGIDDVIADWAPAS